MTPEEAAAQGAGRVEVVAGALSEQPVRDMETLAVMAAICVSAGDMDEAFRRPTRLVAARMPAGARLTAGPDRCEVAGGRGLQMQFEEPVPPGLYGESASVQSRVETAFQGLGMVWVFQLISPADALQEHVPAYETALGTWRWTAR
jgi:hypothetical protein